MSADYRICCYCFPNFLFGLCEFFYRGTFSTPAEYLSKTRNSELAPSLPAFLQSKKKQETPNTRLSAFEVAAENFDRSVNSPGKLNYSVRAFANKVEGYRCWVIGAGKAFKPTMLNVYRTPPSNPYQYFVCLYRSLRQMFAG